MESLTRRASGTLSSFATLLFQLLSLSCCFSLRPRRLRFCVKQISSQNFPSIIGSIIINMKPQLNIHLFVNQLLFDFDIELIKAPQKRLRKTLVCINETLFFTTTKFCGKLFAYIMLEKPQNLNLIHSKSFIIK